MPNGFLTDQQLDGLMAVSTGALQRAAARKFPDMAGQMGEFPKADVVSRDLTAQMEAAYPGAEIDRGTDRPQPEMPPLDIHRMIPESGMPELPEDEPRSDAIEPSEFQPGDLLAGGMAQLLSRGMAGRVAPSVARYIVGMERPSAEALAGQAGRRLLGFGASEAEEAAEAGVENVGHFASTIAKDGVTR